MAESDIVITNLTKGQLRELFYRFCIHTKEYRTNRYTRSWKGCNACMLRDIPWSMTISITRNIENKIVRDLCFTIWHEDILNV